MRCLLREHGLPFQAYGDVTFRSKPSGSAKGPGSLAPAEAGPHDPSRGPFRALDRIAEAS